jgi:ABC-type nickel/cobalt efflux system permease component RcnA
MNSAVITTIAATGFIVAFFHAALPTHWLAFVLVGRSRGWSRAKTILVTLWAGLGHVTVTSLLGVGIAWFGFRLDERVGALFPWLIGAILIGVGAYYLRRQAQGRGVCHHHPAGGHHRPSADCGHEDDHSHWDEELKDSRLMSTRASDWTAISGLFLMLTFSPCEGFLPIYLSAVRFGWRGFGLLTVILAVAALAGMTVFTWLTLQGLERLKVQRIERHEAGLVGGMFCLLGVLVVLLEH